MPSKSGIKTMENKLIIEPIERIRSQMKFSSLEELSNQIKLDADLARSIFKKL